MAPKFLLVAVCLAASPALFSRGVTPVAPGPVPVGAIGLDSASCGTCHRAEYAQWKGSLHAHAGDDTLYVASLRAEPGQDCLNCHTPLRTTKGVDALHEGVGCAACHVREGVVLTSTAEGAAKTSPHALRFEPRLATEEACAGCHQFNFPDPNRGHGHFTDEPMQDTVGEHARAPAHGKRCQACHMAEGGHAFPGGHDEEFVRHAVNVTAAQDADGAVTLTLRSEAGHATPTGDLFRHLVLKLDAGAQVALRVDGHELSAPVAVPLERVFEQRLELVGAKSVTRKRLVADGRIPASGERVIRVTAGAEAGVLRYVLEYRFVSDALAEHLGVKDHALGYTVATGEVNFGRPKVSDEKGSTGGKP